MFGLNKIIFCSLILALTSASAQQMDNETLSLISLYNFSSNSLRAGFEPFYTFTNSFIDNLFELHVPNQVKQLANSSWTNFWNGIIQDYDLKSGLFQNLKFATTVQPGMVNFTIISILISALLPIIGFCICWYRTCCRGKFNPFDNKYDTYKRKIYSIILFILLVASLIGTVILFFTGQNSLLAFKNFPKVVNSFSGQINDFSREEIPRFFTRTNQVVDKINTEAIDIFDTTLRKNLEISVKSLSLKSFFELYNKDLAPELNKLHSMYLNIIEIPTSLNETNLNASAESIKIFNRFQNDITTLKLSLKENFQFLNEIKSEKFDLDSLLPLMNQKLEIAQSNFSNSVGNFLKDIKSQVRSLKSYVESKLFYFSSIISSQEINEYLKLSIEYYYYFYYVLLGVSVFMLSLFIIHSLGMGGICSRRMHNNQKQSCHRGLSANLFSAGTTFYFLFASCLIVLCTTMFLPGITLREVACKPVLDFEENQVFQMGLELTNLSEFLGNSSVKQIVFECDQKNSSLFLSNKFKMMLDEKIGTMISKMMDKFRPGVAKIDFDSVSNLMLNFQNFVESIFNRINSQDTTFLMDKIKSLQFFNITSDQSLDILDEQLSTLVKSQVENLIQFGEKVKDPKIKEAFSKLLESAKQVRVSLDDESTREKFKTSLENTLSKETLPMVEQLKNAKIQELVNAMPSCKILSNIYQSFTLSVCYEFIDNFNSFWSTLYILVILFFVICCFALVQADLLRKFYRYDELLDEDEGDEKGSAQIDLQRQRSSRSHGGAIDAYEMKGYNQAGMKYPSNRSLPSIRNTRA